MNEVVRTNPCVIIALHPVTAMCDGVGMNFTFCRYCFSSNDSCMMGVMQTPPCWQLLVVVP